MARVARALRGVLAVQPEQLLAPVREGVVARGVTTHTWVALGLLLVVVLHGLAEAEVTLHQQKDRCSVD